MPTIKTSEPKTLWNKSAEHKPSNRLNVQGENFSKPKMTQLETVLFADLFNDYYDKRWRVYRVNFFRGIFFGLGTFIGGTVVVTLVILFIGWLADTVPVFPEFTQWLLRTLGG